MTGGKPCTLRASGCGVTVMLRGRPNRTKAAVAVRRSSRGNDLGCSRHLEGEPDLEIVEGDLLDLSSLSRLCSVARPDLFFNTAAQSHVGTSFKEPVHTALVTGVGVLNCLEAIRLSGIHTRFLQCSSSEMFGGVSSEPGNERTPFHPRSPYACAKCYGYYITQTYREAYKIFACNSICYNHESPRRGETFVTRKITRAIGRIKHGLQDRVYLGNLDARRDWGFAGDYTRGMILMLEAAEPDDYVLGTGKTHSVREFCELAFEYAGLGNYEQYVEIDPRFYRPAEVNVLVADFSKAKRKLGWQPETTFKGLVEMMVDHDLQLAEREAERGVLP